MNLCLCYHINIHHIPEIPPLPEVYIVSQKDGILQYLEKQASSETLIGTAIEYKGSAHEQLLNLCEDLTPRALEKRFQPAKKRKKQTLPELIVDSKIKEVLLNFVQRKLTTFYQLLINNKYPLCLGIKRNEALEPLRIHYPTTPLDPILQFTKTATGISYAFTLQHRQKQYIPKDHNIQLLLNEPGVILLNQTLYTLHDLNANKIKPFLTKTHIEVPEKLLTSYLEKIIIPIIKKIEVQTDGFEIEIHKNIQSYTLEILEDFTQKKFIGNVLFDYQNASFAYSSNKKTTSEIVMDDTDQIHILQTQRDRIKEEEIIGKLTSKGLTLSPSKFFEISAEDDTSELLEWIKKNRADLEKENFNIKLPVIQGRTVTLASAHVNINSTPVKDWFDIYGTLYIGDHQLPFTQLIPFIRNNNSYFPVDETTLFIIPSSWMSRYKQLATLGKKTGERFRIPKSNYIVLEGIIAPETMTIKKQTEVIYEPSPLLQATLRPYQQEGVQWLLQHYENGLGACLADDMGLGKTLQTIAMLVYAKEHATETTTPQQREIQFDLFSEPLTIKTMLKALVVLPSSLVFNWAQEIKKFAPHFSIALYTGSDRKKLAPYLDNYDVVLTSYAIVTRDAAIFQKFQFQYLIIDESQQIKNKESKIFQSINAIPTHHKISLSGTPIENSLSDLWSQMQFINPGILGSFEFFKEHFKTPIEKHRDPERIIELKTLVGPFILRRTKDNVAKDLPSLSEQIQYTDMLPDQKHRYESEKSAARNALLRLDPNPKNKIKILNTLMKLRQLANHPVLVDTETGKDTSGKFKDVTAFLQTLVQSQKKVLVFSSFVSHLQIYEQWCLEQEIGYTTLTGQTDTDKRKTIVNEFLENEKLHLFFISLKAGGVGLNLTAASYVVLLDPWWNPFVEKQAVARAHRIGQKNKVLVTRFITKDSIEEKILRLQEQKKQLSEDIIDVNSMPDYIETELAHLLA